MTHSTAKTTATNDQLQQRKNRAIARGEANIAPIYIERAKNAELWDVEGRRFIDFASGIAVCNTGHSHPDVVAAVHKQVDRFSHTCVMVTPYESAVILAERLNALAPGDSQKKTVLVTTGAEAVENAVKIARAYTKRTAVIAFDGGYHGRTNFTLGLTGKNAPYKTNFGPFPNDIYRVPFPIACHGVSVEDSFAALQQRFVCDIDPGEVAAIIVEPVQGEGGFYPAPTEFLTRLRALCDEHGIVLIADEIQTGFARTGKMFATEYADIEPDLITMAKGMAGGFPIAAVVGKAEIVDAPVPGGLGGTYAGSPIACAAALAVLDVIEQEQLARAALNIAEQFQQCLVGLQQAYPSLIGDIRTDRGAMMAVELICDGDPDQPNTDLLNRVITQCFANGLITLKSGIRNNVCRFLPPLTIGQKTLEEGLALFETSFRAAAEDQLFGR